MNVITPTFGILYLVGVVAIFALALWALALAIQALRIYIRKNRV